MTRVEFDRRRYQFCQDMVSWCREYVGNGTHYGFTTVPGGPIMWTIHVDNGNMTFRFVEEKHALAFMLKFK